VAPGSEQTHVFSLGGQFWPNDAEIAQSNEITSHGIGPWETFDAEIRGGAGGLMRTVGDFSYGDLRRPFTEAGMWGLMRVMSDPSCPIRPLDGGLTCSAQPRAPVPVDVDVAERPSPAIEAAAYFVVAEAPTNVAKYSGTQRAAVHIRRLGDEYACSSRTTAWAAPTSSAAPGCAG
jgi:hypothetical protein